MAELLIIADDLTGAIETGVQLSQQKILSKVILSPDSALDVILVDKQSTAVVINIESRHLLPEESMEKVSHVLEIAIKSGIKWFYKKTDSTLRGNIGAELDAFLHGTNQHTLPYIAAHPKLKRYTRGGFQYIGVNLLHQTEFARDPLEPITSSFIPEILKKQTGVEICVLNTAEIPDQSLSGCTDKKIIVFDCRSEADLKAIGRYVYENGWHKAMAGTAAMVELLPGLLQLGTTKSSYGDLKGPLLLINGSLNDRSRQQVLYAHENGIATFVFPHELLSVPDLESNPDFIRLVGKITRELKMGNDVIVNTTYLGKNTGEHRSDTNSGKDYFKSVSIKPGTLVSSILNEVAVSSLCVFGGDTLTGIMDMMGCDSIEPQREIFPGVALASVQSNFGKIHLMSKPGGYGQEELILQIINHIKK